jgi:putative chitinase
MIDLKKVARYYQQLPHQRAALDWLQTRLTAADLEEFAQKWRNGPKPLLTVDDLLKITIVAPRQRLQQFVEPLNAGFARFAVNTPLRICHFLAQVLHESAEFQYQEEIASGAAYEGRADLGNTVPGDGARFKGRGLIQITGRENYRDLSAAIGVDYVANPAQLAEIPDCVDSAFWYWNDRNLSALADQDNFDQITYRVNGGYNGYDDRRKYLNRAKDVLL